jgi:hypothetical protein
MVGHERSEQNILRDRIMVVHVPLEDVILVRVQVPQQNEKRSSVDVFSFCCEKEVLGRTSDLGSKGGAGPRLVNLGASHGREKFLCRQKFIPDRVPSPGPQVPSPTPLKFQNTALNICFCL